jgi:hypothetical protein
LNGRWHFCRATGDGVLEMAASLARRTVSVVRTARYLGRTRRNSGGGISERVVSESVVTAGCDRQAALTAEVVEVLSALRDHRMVRRKRRGRNCRRPSKERLGIAQSSCLLGDDGEVGQRARQIRMKRTQFGFLRPSGVLQQLVAEEKSPSMWRSAISVCQHQAVPTSHLRLARSTPTRRTLLLWNSGRPRRAGICRAGEVSSLSIPSISGVSCTNDQSLSRTFSMGGLRVLGRPGAGAAAQARVKNRQRNAGS